MSDVLPELPFPRPDVIEVAPSFAELRKMAPIVKARTRSGDEAWLALGYAEARELFSDERFGRSHPDPANAPRISTSVMFGGPQGDHATEYEEHRRMRRLLTPSFSARRMQRLGDHVRELAANAVGRLSEMIPPVDLHEQLSFPLPVMVICELLGVPYADRETFRVWTDKYGDMSDPEGARAALQALARYMHELIAVKRADPGQDVITDLAAAVDGITLTDDQIATIAVNVLFGGHETTVSRIDYGTLLFLRHPEQAAAVRADPTLLGPAVDEILRIAAPSDHGFSRYAHEDVDIGGVRIFKGDALLLFPSIANRDPAVFNNPESFDIRRTDPPPNLAFGYGRHFCVGATLARVELEAVFGELLRRLPTLRLAVPFEQLRLNTDRIIGGLAEFPVTW